MLIHLSFLDDGEASEGGEEDTLPGALEETDLETKIGGHRLGGGQGGGGEAEVEAGDGGQGWEGVEAGETQLLHLGSSWTRSWKLTWREPRPSSTNS